MPELARSPSSHTAPSPSSTAPPQPLRRLLIQRPRKLHPLLADDEDKDEDEEDEEDEGDKKDQGDKEDEGSKLSSGISGSSNDVDAEAASEADEDTWFAIKDIIDEKKDRRGHRYLVEWENNKDTGESYPNEWIPARDANTEAVLAWKEIKRARKIKAKPKPKSTKTAKTAKTAKTVKPAANDSQISYANSSSVLTSLASRVLTPPEAPAATTGTAGSRKRSASPFGDNDNDDEQGNEGEAAPRRRKRLQQGHPPGKSRSLSQSQSQNSSGQALPSSPPASRETSFESLESLGSSKPFESLATTEPVTQAAEAVATVAAAATVAAVEIIPAPDFDPNDYARFSQFASQSQAWTQPPISSQEISQDDSQDNAEDNFLSTNPQPPSTHTIPDSQADSTTIPSASDDSQSLFVEQFKEDGPGEVVVSEKEAESQPQPDSAGATQPTPPDIPSRQPDVGSADDAHPAPPPTSQDNQLRASADWASEEEPPAPQGQGQANQPGSLVSTGAIAASASGSGSGISEPIRFLTQPEPDFDLLTQQQDDYHRTPGVAQTPVLLPGPDSNNYSGVSVVPDSTRPARATTGDGCAFADSLPSSAQIVQPLHSDSQDDLLHGLFDSLPFLSRPKTPPYQNTYRAATMDGNQQPPSSAVDVLKQALQSALGDDGIDSIDDPLVLAEIRRMEQESQGGTAFSQQQTSQSLEEIANDNNGSNSASADISVPTPAAETTAAPTEPIVSAEPIVPLIEQQADLVLAPDVPEVLEVPRVPEEPQVQEAPQVSDVSQVPEQPEAPEAPQAPEELETPEAPRVAGASLLALPNIIGPDGHGLLSHEIMAADNEIPGAQHIGGAMEDVGDIHPGTIAPADLSFADPISAAALELSPEPEYPLMGLRGYTMVGGEDVDDGSGDADYGDDNGLEQPSSPLSMIDADDRDDDLPPNPPPNFSTPGYVVTLPLAANTRQSYLDLIMDKANQHTVKEFGEVFSRDIYEVPAADTIARVNDLLRKLLDLSDLPPYYDSLPSMSNEFMMKHAVDTNSKYSFVHEFLDGIGTLDKTVLILARKGVALDYLEAVITFAGISVQRLNASSSADSTKQPTDERRRTSSLSVLLGDTADIRAASLPAKDVDIVIGFDHTARTSGLLAHYLVASATDDATTATASATTQGREGRHLPKPVVLLLVGALSLEHIDLRLELDSVDDLERKNALLLCTLECLTYLRDMPYDEAPAKPHEAAEAFAKIVADPSAVLEWEPTPLPEDVFDIYMHSSGAAQPTFTQDEILGGSLLRSRKRQLEDDGHGEDSPKRARLSEPTTPIVPELPIQFSDTIKHALGRLHVAGDTSGPTVQISLAQLEALAAKATDLETQLQEKHELEATLIERVRSLDRLVKGSTATINECQKKMFLATKERGVFEVERDNAFKEAAATKEKLESRTSALAELRAEKKALEARAAEADALLAGASQPDVAQLGTARVALQAAEAKVAVLERKAANADTDLAHARRAYQDASNAAADLSTENRDLGARVKELDRLAADNLRHIHETHNRNEAEAFRQQWTEAVTMLRERERDLEWARDELRILKNGRRETRQQSVPRSPRLSVISPRIVSGRGGSAGGGAAGGGGGGGSSSGGTGTPIPGAGYAIAARTSVSRGNSPVTASFDPSVYGAMSSMFSGITGGVGGNGSGSAGGSGSGGTSGGPPLPGMTYLSSSQGGGRWGHLRE